MPLLLLSSKEVLCVKVEACIFYEDNILDEVVHLCPQSNPAYELLFLYIKLKFNGAQIAPYETESHIRSHQLSYKHPFSWLFNRGSGNALCLRNNERIVLCHFYVNPRANLKNNDIPETYKVK